MAEMKDLERIREDAEERQRAILVPDLIRSGRSVDEFMWKGDPKASPVQRIGLLIFGVMFLVFFALAVLLIVTRKWEGLPVGLVVGVISGIFSFRFLRNAFKKKPR
jgi:Flp pilus assembly protein TadB